MENIINAKLKYTYRVDLDTMSDVREFVSAASKCEDRVLIRAGALVANAKSLLGVMLASRINWNDIILESDRDHYGEFRKFIVE